MSPRTLVVTPARNEADYLPHLIAGMRTQTRTPDRWIIVDDGSTDGTGRLARQLCSDLPWVEIVEHTGTERRHDSSKARRVNEVIESMFADGTGSRDDVIVTFDADIVPPPGYLDAVERAYGVDPSLGVFGGIYTHHGITGVKPEPFPADIVPGGTTSIRRAAYDDIGGYWALPFGGIDHAACVAVQLHGWTSRHDPALVCDHLRPLGTGEGTSARRGMYRRGREDYDLGVPLWFELVKVGRWLVRRPFVVGALWMGGGYLHSFVARTPHSVPDDFLAFNRGRARARLTGAFRRTVST
ncbi:MAG: glycosyltransferase family A protein [Actinobacteria bacterium]|nr:glycosyltransferase family A protein [Actinomycetota bacterium]